ncbi:F-box/kelch-repeat protein At3g06240-like [Apium graveolens]|uniref:F-box/kelch-repeat protein At3g06240-like n=1 Tax=Apium graveolens TaxID=4045 RepID=UPI003D7AEF9C
MERGHRSKRRKRSKNSCELPQEIVYVILLLIPASILLKLRAICKSWMRLICSSDFIRAHTLLWKEDDSHLLVRCKTPFFNAQTMYLYSLFDNAISTSYDLPSPVRNSHVEGILVGCCRGVSCLSFDDGSIILWNPCTKESEKLSNSSRGVSGSYEVYGFAYSESINKFLVVCLCTSCDEVLEFVTQTKVCKGEGWQRLSDFPFGSPFYNSGKFVNGSLNWLASKKPVFNLGVVFDTNEPWVIVSFNVENETYSEIMPPKFPGNDYDLT